MSVIYFISRFFAKIPVLPFGLRDRILRCICPIGTNYHFSISWEGLIYKGNLNNFIDWNVFFYGYYEKNILIIIKSLYSTTLRNTILDIGANTGQHTLYFSTFATFVHSFEPYPKFYNILENRIKDNTLKNVGAHNIGLSNKKESLYYHAPSKYNENWGTGSFIENYNSKLTKSNIKFKLEKGDDFLELLNIDKISLIKIDVEGFEKEVIEGLQNTIKKNNPIIIMEFSIKAFEKFDSIDNLLLLFPPSYSVYGINKKKIVPFNSNLIFTDLVLLPFKA